ncbi:hypothetical protein RI367_006725 [Sorochytrium milnesiophthora]
MGDSRKLSHSLSVNIHTPFDYTAIVSALDGATLGTYVVVFNVLFGNGKFARTRIGCSLVAAISLHFVQTIFEYISINYPGQQYNQLTMATIIIDPFIGLADSLSMYFRLALIPNLPVSYMRAAKSYIATMFSLHLVWMLPLLVVYAQTGQVIPSPWLGQVYLARGILLLLWDVTVSVLLYRSFIGVSSAMVRVFSAAVTRSLKLHIVKVNVITFLGFLFQFLFSDTMPTLLTFFYALKLYLLYDFLLNLTVAYQKRGATDDKSTRQSGDASQPRRASKAVEHT